MSAETIVVVTLITAAFVTFGVVLFCVDHYSRQPQKVAGKPSEGAGRSR